jgi:ClpP class serine protease
MWPFTRRAIVPVLRLSGPIGMASPLRPGLSLQAAADALERAFTMSKLPAVAIVVNSPGGSAVQSSLIFKRIRQLAEEHKKKVYVFCEDVAASGGYYLAVAGDEIYADASSIVGSIGVIFASFGLDKAIARLGIERRVYTAGTSKNVHDVFIGVVKDRRAGKLRGSDTDLFSGAFWSAPRALDLGLIDGVADVRTTMRRLYGDKVVLKAVPMGGGGLLSRLRRTPGGLEHAGLLDPHDVIAALETRALWARFGL